MLRTLVPLGVEGDDRRQGALRGRVHAARGAGRRRAARDRDASCRRRRRSPATTARPTPRWPPRWPPTPPATGSVAAVVAALAGTRVLVPVLAELEVADVVVHDGHEHTVDKEASAGIVALRAPDGRTALPVFTRVATMTAWRPDARPVPSDVARAALSAVTEGWEVLVVDPGGPATVLVPRPAVWALAQQERWRPAVVGGRGRRGGPRRGRRRAGAGRRGGRRRRGARARGPRSRSSSTLVAGLDRAGLDAVLARVNGALAGRRAGRDARRLASSCGPRSAGLACEARAIASDRPGERRHATEHDRAGQPDRRGSRG